MILVSVINPIKYHKLTASLKYLAVQGNDNIVILDLNFNVVFKLDLPLSKNLFIKGDLLYIVEGHALKFLIFYNRHC